MYRAALLALALLVSGCTVAASPAPVVGTCVASGATFSCASLTDSEVIAFDSDQCTGGPLNAAASCTEGSACHVMVMSSPGGSDVLVQLDGTCVTH
jgi:hypothetical protein